MRKLLIAKFLQLQEVVVKDENGGIISIGRKIKDGYLLYQFSDNRFYIHESDNSEYYVDDIIDVIFSSLEDKEKKQTTNDCPF